MNTIDTTAERGIGRDWARSLTLPLICAACSVAMYYGMTMNAESLYEYQFRNGSWVIFPFIAPFTLWVTFRLFWPNGALIRLSPNGFQDCRVSGKIVPWTEIGNIRRKGEFISITLNRKFAKTFALSLSQRAIKFFYKSAGPTHLLVAEWCVAKTETDLLKLIIAYHEHHSSNTAPA